MRHAAALIVSAFLAACAASPTPRPSPAPPEIAVPELVQKPAADPAPKPEVTVLDHDTWSVQVPGHSWEVDESDEDGLKAHNDDAKALIIVSRMFFEGSTLPPPNVFASVAASRIPKVVASHEDIVSVTKTPLVYHDTPAMLTTILTEDGIVMGLSVERPPTSEGFTLLCVAMPGQGGFEICTDVMTHGLVL